tara:strand:- start:368 stop:469 length:102 start_codon:yes stop_codon:yes gene_type:complete
MTRKEKVDEYYMALRKEKLKLIKKYQQYIKVLS